LPATSAKPAAAARVSSYEFQDVGDGKFRIVGDMSFATVESILRESEDLFEDYSRIEVDLSGVGKSDSAGLALLLEWITWAIQTVREIRYVDIPDRVTAIARVTEVDSLLARGERWSGFIEAPEGEE
jgi:phospholipid transport system transporter-binding protein